MEKDILTEVSINKYSEILDTLKSDWPHSIHPYYFIKYFWGNTDKTIKNQLKVYCPENNAEDGVIVAVAMLMPTYQTVMIHCSKTGVKKTEEILQNTSIIDWTQKVNFEATHERLVPVIEAIAEAKNLEYENTAYFQVWLPPEKTKNITLEVLPQELELRDLKDQHTEIINSTWFYRGPGTEEFVRTTVVRNGGIGLFLKGSDSPIAWNTIQHFLGLGMLYTLDDYRNKGYASVVTLALSKRLAEEGIDPYACIKYDNKPSISMFTKLKFETMCMVHWGSTVPKS